MTTRVHLTMRVLMSGWPASVAYSPRLTPVRTFSASPLAEPALTRKSVPGPPRPRIAGEKGIHAQPCAQSAVVPQRIGFIGCGQMGEALLQGFIQSGVSSPGLLSASVRNWRRREFLGSIGVGRTFEGASEGGAAGVAKHSDVIMLGVKPQSLPEVLAALAPHIHPRHLVISIAAGVRLGALQSALGADARVVRVMPNTPCLVRQGASAYALGAAATREDAERVHELLSAVGLAVRVEEKAMDAVTGLSGSGPAFVFAAIEALADGGVAAGLARETALALAAQTVAGAAAMVLTQDPRAGGAQGALTHPAVLKDRVASPAGTTIAGLAELERGALRGTLIRAVKAAAERSEELAGS